MFRSYLHILKPYKFQPYKWIDGSRLSEAAKINSPLHFQNLSERRVYKQKSEPPEVSFPKISVINKADII
ncbi:unnamed protein product [Blepharisma stoltei]|uniref:Uncharacterized protein n=1 Tax=Blepharisma stoltei TaxID=1481888 RepID=A0AAU9IMI2_9CILI|nr:unnamed protein product [Blepharisma stoltei]